MDNLLLERILTMLDEDNHSTVFDFLVQTLQSTSPTHERHRASILTRIPDVLDLVAERSAGRKDIPFREPNMCIPPLQVLAVTIGSCEKIRFNIRKKTQYNLDIHRLHSCGCSVVKSHVIGST
jgi:hypothetical protein